MKGAAVRPMLPIPVRRIPLTEIDALVTARLGRARVKGNAQRQHSIAISPCIWRIKWRAGVLRASADSTMVETIRRYAMPFGGSMRCERRTVWCKSPASVSIQILRAGL